MNQKNFYEKRAIKEFSKTLYPYYGHWRTKQLILSIIRSLPRGRLLDVGCGDGIFLKELENDFDCIGLEISETRIKRAKKITKKSKIIQGDAESLPFKNNSFDYVLFTEIIEHLPNYKKALKEVKRVLKSSGKVILSIPIAGLYRIILARLGKTLFLDPEEHLREWTKYKAKGFTSLKDYYDIITSVGFKIVCEYGTSIPELPLQDTILKNKVLRQIYSKLIDNPLKNTKLKYLGRKLVYVLEKN